MFILVNNLGILLGVYTDRKVANIAIKKILENDDTTSGTMYLYSVDNDEINTLVGNKFECVWISDSKKW